MPRLPDAALEERIVAGAVRLLDAGGEGAITLRAVAKEAGTTTPTIYKRFRDRDVLMQRLVDGLTDEMMAVFQSTRSVEAMVGAFLDESRARPMRVNLMVTTFGARYAAGESMPAFELLQLRIKKEVGIGGRECEDLALAIASLAFGTAQGMIAAGSDTKHAAEFERTAMHALRLLLKAFSRSRQRRMPVRLALKKKARSS
jgi:AcrR family transcriptional regulator